MKYEFHVGDYVETNRGSKGYISDTTIPWWKCTFSGADKFNEGFIYNIIGAGRGDVERFYNRIGQYDFTKTDRTKTIAELTYFDETAMLWKINELVRAVNELRAAQKGET